MMPEMMNGFIREEVDGGYGTTAIKYTDPKTGKVAVFYINHTGPGTAGPLVIDDVTVEAVYKSEAAATRRFWAYLNTLGGPAA